MKVELRTVQASRKLQMPDRSKTFQKLDSNISRTQDGGGQIAELDLSGFNPGPNYHSSPSYRSSVRDRVRV